MPAGAREPLTAAADGLLFISEGEAPFEYVERPARDGAAGAVDTPGVAGPLGAAEVAALFGEATLARETSVAEFLAGHLDAADPEDPVAQSLVPRYRALLAAVEANLDGARAYCFGDAEKRCYLVGRVGPVVAGLRTVAYES